MVTTGGNSDKLQELYKLKEQALMTQAVADKTQNYLSERSSINLIFLAAGLSFASWAGRLSIIDTVFDFSGLTLGSFLLCMTVGTLVGISIIPWISRRMDTRRLLFFLPIGLAICLLVLGVSISLTQNLWLAFAILFVNGIIFGCLDIMMNVSAAKIERQLERSIMPIFHGFFSLGALVGAGIATATISLHVNSIWHFTLVAILLIAISIYAQSGMREWAHENFNKRAEEKSTAPNIQRRKLGTLVLLGLMVAGLSFAEGVANDWITVATVDGHHMTHETGALMFTLFVGAMTLGRFGGGRIVDRFGALRTLMMMGTVGLIGICLFILGHDPWLLSLGAIMWGLGSALGFPVGMSIAAAHGGRLGPRAVSIISAFGYGAMLSGPPLIGFVVDSTGLPQALWIAAVLILISLLITPRVARKPAGVQAIA